ncbi:hypothetical protein PISMIDRAFT_672565 [Pisolithus microcarpus 441]|uniref:Uncharacterized protein n=1 Tax=Pisolithus microcarpus 441 TaxID=765257 RepID=A0A0C9YVP8_9AGAM|nr:hypothetical protein PISMIDRAFT_672565 [Pisolithus microcarpus 441]
MHLPRHYSTNGSFKKSPRFRSIPISESEPIVGTYWKLLFTDIPAIGVGASALNGRNHIRLFKPPCLFYRGPDPWRTRACRSENAAPN